MLRRQVMQRRSTPGVMVDFVQWTFDTAGQKVGWDEEGRLQGLVVASAIAHVHRNWQPEQKLGFLSSIKRRRDLWHA